MNPGSNVSSCQHPFSRSSEKDFLIGRESPLEAVPGVLYK